MFILISHFALQSYEFIWIPPCFFVTLTALAIFDLLSEVQSVESLTLRLVLGFWNFKSI